MDYLYGHAQHQYPSWQHTVRHPADEWNDTQLFDPGDLFDAHQPYLQHTPESMDRYMHDSNDPWFSTREPFPPALHFETPAHLPPLVATFENNVQHQFASPSIDDHSTTEVSSGWSDRQSTPWSSPGPSAHLSPQGTYIDNATVPFGGGDCHQDMNGVVCMHDVQYQADAQPEQPFFDDDPMSHYATIAEEGYQPREPEIDHRANGIRVDVAPVAPPAETQPESPNLRRRSVQSRRSPPCPPVTSPRVAKRPSTSRRASASSIRSTNRRSEIISASSSNRAFPCVFFKYGCTSSFGSKNEWKRHIFTQHMQPGYWRCDQCPAVSPTGERKPNDFKRKDLFIQHLRRMHSSSQTTPPTPPASRSPSSPASSKKGDPEDARLARIAERCYVFRRALPAKSGCHFCDARFEAPRTWDERMEHVGGHMEACKKEGGEGLEELLEGWREDGLVHEYLVGHGIVERRGDEWAISE